MACAKVPARCGRPAGVDRLAVSDRRAAYVPGLQASPARRFVSSSHPPSLRGARRFPLLDQLHPLLQCRPLCRVGPPCGHLLARLAHQHRCSPSLFLGEPLRPRVAVGALLGLAGISLMFWHELDGSSLGFAPADRPRTRHPRLPFLLGRQHDRGPDRSTMASPSFRQCLGRDLRRRRQRPSSRSPPAAPSSSNHRRAMSSRCSGSPCPARCSPSGCTSRCSAASARTGPAYTAVLSPVLALLVSTVVEDYRWSALALVGLASSRPGNVLVLRRGKR